MGQKKDKSKEEEVEVVEENDDEELAEAEDDVSGEGSVEFPESDFEIDDFSIGDISLATAREESGTWKHDLEESVDEDFPESWEEHDEEQDEDALGEGIYHSSSIDHDYSPPEKGRDVYSGDSGGGGSESATGAYDVDSSRLNDIRDDKGEKKLWSDERLPGMARSEKKTLDRIGGVFVPGFKKKGKEQKYQ